LAGAATHDVPHRWVDAQPLRVVHILVAGQPTGNRLLNEWQQGMTGVAAGAGVLQPLPRRCRESQRLVEFSICKQTGVAGYLAPHERQPHSTVEIDTQVTLLAVTHAVPLSEEQELAGNP